MARRTYKFTNHTSTALNIFSNPGEFSDLRDEMQEWGDNLESNGMEHLPKYEAVSEATETLDSAWTELEHLLGALETSLEEGKPLAALAGVEVTFTEMVPYKGRGYPRWMRLTNSAVPLSAAVEALREVLDDIEEPEDDAPAEDKAKHAAAEELRNELDEIDGHLGELDAVEFPGMFG